MNDVARRAEPVEQLAFAYEGLLRVSHRFELEPHTRPDQVPQALAQIMIVSSDAMDPERLLRINMPQRIDAALVTGNHQFKVVER